MQEFITQNWFSILVAFYVVGYFLSLIAAWPENLKYNPLSVKLVAGILIVLIFIFWPVCLLIAAANK